MNCSDKGSVARLNLMDDELVVRISSRLKRGRSCGHECGRNSGSRSGGDIGGHASSSGDHGNGGGDVMSDECHYCKKKGHWAKECSSVRSSAMVVDVGVDVVKSVNALNPSDLHRHYPGMAFMKDVVGVHIHYGWRPSDQCMRLPLIG
jgi:hypothetical protein